MVSIYQPSDFHVHLREGSILKEALKENIKHFQRILIMPNLLKPITNSKRLLDYRNQVERINNNQIDISTLSDGVYFISFNNEKNKFLKAETLS